MDKRYGIFWLGEISSYGHTGWFLDSFHGLFDTEEQALAKMKDMSVQRHDFLTILPVYTKK